MKYVNHSMLIFCHLFVGIALGFVFAWLFKNKFAIIFTAVGAILPDLIDKPLGHILLAETVGDGRIYAHSLMFVGVLAVLGLILFITHREKVAVLCIAAGALSHQLLDFMWHQLSIWLWPFSGSILSDAGVQTIFTHYMPAVLAAVAELAVFAVVYFVGFRKRSPMHKLIFTFVFLAVEFVSLLLLKVLISGASFSLGGEGYVMLMLGKELGSYSEWVFGIGALLVLTGFFAGAGVSTKLYPAAGVFSMAAGLLMPVFSATGLFRETGYALAGAVTAMFCLVVCGAVVAVFAHQTGECGSFRAG